MATPKGLAKRDAIAEAAAQVLIAEGLEAVNHRAVASAAGVPLGSTTYHFAGLDDLRQAAADRLADADIARMTDAVGRFEKRQRSASTVARTIVDLVVPPGDHELITWYERYARAAREPVLAGPARRTNRAALHSVRAVLDASGRTAQVDAALVLSIVDGAILGSLAEGDRPDGARQRASNLLAALLNRLG